jgi:integrase/recombinase XerD
VKHIIDDHVVLSRPLEGPLATQIAAFARYAREEGYARQSRYRRVLLAAGFSRWLGQQAVRRRRISSEHPKRYLRSRARWVQVHNGDAAALRQFLDFLRRHDVIPAEKVSPGRLTAVEQEARAFEHFLNHERALARATCVNYVPFVRRFLTDRFGRGPVALSRLSAGDVVRFVQRQAPRLHLKRAKLLTSAMRSFLRYARYRGEVTRDLAAAVPVVANWSKPSIPRAIGADQVRQLLASIDRCTPMGRRDYAIVLLLARLGLRAGEVACLELDDIDWDAGELSVRGKGGPRTALPLPAEVCKAIAAYLRHGRRPSTSRRVFLRSKAPIRGFLGQCAIGSIVRHALQRTGIQAPTTGPISFATRWRPRCCAAGPRSPKSARSSGIAVPKPRQSTPRWTSRHYGRSRCGGREVRNDHAAAGRGGVCAHAASSGIQAV